MPTGFSTGFGSGLGGNGQAQLILIVGSHPTYQDGDIICAFNRRRIRDVHAQHICHVKHATHNADGLHDLDTLPEVLRINTRQYKFERISATEVRRTDLDTLDQLVFSNTPISVNGHMEHMDVKLFVKRRRAHSRHAMFGSNGNEVWYGGRTNGAYDRLTTIWNEIEARTVNREENFTEWPATPKELKRFLIISTNDFDDATAGDLTAPLLDETDPDNPFEVSKRKNWITWRDLRDVVEVDVLNKSTSVDMRGRKQVRQSVVNTRTV